MNNGILHLAWRFLILLLAVTAEGQAETPLSRCGSVPGGAVALYRRVTMPAHELFALSKDDYTIYASTDTGATWQRMGIITSEYPLNIRCFLVIGQMFLVGTEEGIVADDQGGQRKWLAGEPIASLSLNERTKPTQAIYACLANGRILCSRNMGLMWESAGNSLPGQRIRSLIISFLNPSIVYASAESGGIWRSKDNFQTWTEVNTGLARIEGFSVAMSLFRGGAPPKTMEILYAASLNGELYRSTDQGDTWGSLTVKYPNQEGSVAVYHIAVAPINTTSNRVYLLLNDGQVYYFDDAVTP